MIVRFADKARKEFLKLDKPIQKQIQVFILTVFILKLEKMKDLRATGKALSGNLLGRWRYRVGDYRLVCEIDDKKILITILRVAHRKDVYKN